MVARAPRSLVDQDARHFTQVLGAWPSSVADLRTDVYVATGALDNVHTAAFVEYVRAQNPSHVRAHIESDGGRLFALQFLGQSLQHMLSMQVVGDDSDASGAYV